MAKKTYTIQIGNSDNKLNQKNWSEFVRLVTFKICDHSSQIHFSAGSPSEAEWQNFCWVIDINDDEELNWLKRDLTQLRMRFNQDSIALTAGITEFI